jgi:hypothetical protein
VRVVIQANVRVPAIFEFPLNVIFPNVSVPAPAPAIAGLLEEVTNAFEIALAPEELIVIAAEDPPANNSPLEVMDPFPDKVSEEEY